MNDRDSLIEGIDIIYEHMPRILRLTRAERGFAPATTNAAK